MKLGLACVALTWFLPLPALAHVERFAIVAGNNQGVGADGQLSYAAADATRVYDVLRELGGFQPANMVLLHDEDADTLRRSLITVNERIRTAISLPDTQVMLFVYYSGHADGEDLHLAGTRLPVAEFAQLVRGSAASFRLLVLDACRSGTLTRTKGGKIKPAFPIPDETLPGDGVAFLTASAVSEDAQESESARSLWSIYARSLPRCLQAPIQPLGVPGIAVRSALRWGSSQ